MAPITVAIDIPSALHLPPLKSDLSILSASPVVLNPQFDSYLDPPPVLLSGTLSVDIAKDPFFSFRTIKAIGVSLLGYENAYHPSGPPSQQRILKETVELWLKHDNNDPLPPGIHAFDFSMPVPVDAPPTLKIEYAEVEYYVEATVNRSLGGDIKVRKNVRLVRGWPTAGKGRGSLSRPESRASTPRGTPNAGTPVVSRKAKEYREADIEVHYSPVLNRKGRLSRNSKSSMQNPTSGGLDSHDSPIIAPIDKSGSNFSLLNRASSFVLDGTPRSSQSNLSTIGRTYTSPTSPPVYTYTVSLPHPFFLDTTPTIVLSLSPCTHALQTLQSITATLHETRTFPPSQLPALPTSSFPLKPPVESKVISPQPVKYKLLGGSETSNTSFPIPVETKGAVADMATDAFSVTHSLRILLEYLDTRLADCGEDASTAETSTPSTPVTLRKGKAKLKSLTIEIPVEIREPVPIMGEDSAPEVGPAIDVVTNMIRHAPMASSQSQLSVNDLASTMSFMDFIEY
ncbi:hypothetical protein HDU85_005339 [Gaertneriomyces sp. JEL0708]|nr:hypothetical protein HDU85_005339 [Gaertneriomyces sp. JEL0708]